MLKWAINGVILVCIFKGPYRHISQVHASCKFSLELNRLYIYFSWSKRISHRLALFFSCGILSLSSHLSLFIYCSNALIRVKYVLYMQSLVLLSRSITRYPHHISLSHIVRKL